MWPPVHNFIAMHNELFGKVDDYICRLLAPEDEALRATVQSIEASGIPQISVSASQGKLLQVMAMMCGAKNILELGTLAGYSTIWLARSLPAGGRLISLEYDATHAAIARENIARAGLDAIVEIRTGAALDMLPVLEAEGAGPFDMIFIDADKPPYAEYFQWALKLSRKGSVIIADNVIREGKVLDDAGDDDRVTGVQRFNTMLSGCRGVTAVIMQNVGVKEHDGMAIAVVN